MNYLQRDVSDDFTLAHAKHLTALPLGPLIASCLLCGNDSNTSAICHACAAELPQIPALHCQRCSIPTPYGETCGDCLQREPSFEKTTAAFHYTYPIDRLIQAFKYAHRTALAKWFASQLAPRLTPNAIDLILPMPLHPTRLRERGFNQSGEIARHLSAYLDKPLALTTLLRTKATRPQVELRMKDRTTNIRNAFECQRDLTGAAVLLVDDVMTSGATVREASRVLKIHGAAYIEIAVAARAY